MRLADYENAQVLDKKMWLDSIKMKVGLPYFGGKSIIGKYIFNNIFNMAVMMKQADKKADIFIDAFTGGGKIGLSIPKGWFDTIVINDLDYGVYSYYKCCKDRHVELIMMIDKIAEFIDRDMFHTFAWLRTFGKNCDKFEEDNNKVTDDEILDELSAAAMTYWVTSSAFNSITAPQHTSYNLTRVTKESNEDGEKEYDKKLEMDNIEKIRLKAHKNIQKLHYILNSQNYIIENLDYRELIKKYNGLEYEKVTGEKVVHTNIESTKEQVYIQDNSNKVYADKNILWYFDPPYHPYALHAGKDAPYAYTFTVKLANEMVQILDGTLESTYGKLDYFIKSDYDPKDAYAKAEEYLKKGNSYLSAGLEDWYKEIIELEKDNHKITRAFDSLEKYPFMKVCVGSFDKGTMVNTDEEGKQEKSVGTEYIWTKGFPENYNAFEMYDAK